MTVTEQVLENLTGLAALQLEDASDELHEALTRGFGVEEPGGGVGSRIAKVRAERRMTGAVLGGLVGLGKDQVSKIESGKRRVDVSELPRFAEALGVSVGRLLGQPERPALTLAARLASGVAPAALEPARRRARQLLELDDLLTQVTDLPAARSSEAGQRVIALAGERFAQKPRSVTAARKQGRALADLTRAELDLGSDALGDIAALIEQHFAVDVSLSPLGTDADGLCVHAGRTALVLASTDYSDGHVRFTLAHELGHHALGDPRAVIEEDEHAMFADARDLGEVRVNAFAAHLLMPERGVRAVLQWIGERPGSISYRGVVALMEHFGVSRQALIYQLNQLGLMSFEAGQRLQQDVSVAAMVAAHTDVAPTGAATTARHVHRAPERLTRRALQAARSQRLGLSVVAALLGRADDQQLWNEVMGAGDAAPTTPVAL